ncbi:MAG: hypothetical protein APR54_12750 [Candidatus Cloacimonas sp. SDB]|nr:MAG: hypothetical protein APR54_12750 [Candidatus Cloacimonas sp. SDB]
MKKKKWLLITVLILFFINFVFYVVVRWGKVDLIVKNRVKNYLEDKLDAEILIRDFTFNDKQLNINGFQISDIQNRYSLNVKQIFIEYNLPMLIFSNFTNYKAIKEIKIFDPILIMHLQQQLDTEKSQMIIPDIARYFKHLSLYNGKIDFSYQGNSVNIHTVVDTFQLTLTNTSKTRIEYELNDDYNAHSGGNILLSKGEIEAFDLNFTDFGFQNIEIEGIDELFFKLDINLVKENSEFSAVGKVKDLLLQKADNTLKAERIPFSADEKAISLELQHAFLDGFELFGSGKITDYLQAEKQIAGQFEVNNLTVGRYLQKLAGKANLKINIQGSVMEPIVEFQINSDMLQAYSQEIKDVVIESYYFKDSLHIRLENLSYLNNLISGEGYYLPDSGLNMQINGRNFYWAQEDLSLQGDFRADLDYYDELLINFISSDLQVKYRNLHLENLILKCEFKNELIDLELNRKKEDFKLALTGDINSKELNADLDLLNFDLADFLDINYLPQISGSVNIKGNEKNIQTNASLRVFDRNYAGLNGRIILISNLALSNKALQLTLRTSQAQYNFEPFSLSIIAEGSLDNLEFKRFDINREIFINGNITSNPQQKIDLNLSFTSLDLRKYLKYFTNYNFYSLIQGKATMNLNYSTGSKNPLSGTLQINKFNYNRIKDFDILTEIQGSAENLESISSFKLNNRKKLFEIYSNITLGPQFRLNSSGNIADLDLSEIFTEDDVEGKVNAVLDLKYHSTKKILMLDVEARDLRVNWFEADSLVIMLNQQNEMLDILDFSAGKKKSYNLQAAGKLGYNLLNASIFPDSNRINLKFNGDILKMLSGKSSLLSAGKSKCELDLMIGMAENGISVSRGKFNLNGGSVKLANQPETVEKITINFDIQENLLTFNKFSGKIGEGNFFLENLIENSEDEFFLGNLQIGKLFLYTDFEGILIHLPNYMPGNSLVKAVIKGRNSDKLAITGPFDDILIKGDVHFSNGNAIYPANTENLVKFFSKMTEEKIPRKYDIPLKLDLILHFEENVRYVTYPLNLLVDSGSYMNLIFDNEKFSVTDADFTSESGMIDIFGTQMQADYVQVKISPYENRVHVSGTFFQQAADGTLITLLVTSVDESETNRAFALDFDLYSDNANDSRIDILALLRYGRRQDEISPDQRKTILQDEIIQLAGLGVESALLDPFISPVETWIRRLLNLDFFHLQTDLIQNIFNRYSSDRTDYILDETGERISQNTSEIFLNNLSIGMGKFLSRNVFLDYELEFQKTQDLAVVSDIGIYHNFSLRYDLPFRFKLVYKFHIMPFNEKNTHEISLEKSIRF